LPLRENGLLLPAKQHNPKLTEFAMKSEISRHRIPLSAVVSNRMLQFLFQLLCHIFTVPTHVAYIR